MTKFCILPMLKIVANLADVDEHQGPCLNVLHHCSGQHNSVAVNVLDNQAGDFRIRLFQTDKSGSCFLKAALKTSAKVRRVLNEEILVSRERLPAWPGFDYDGLSVQPFIRQRVASYAFSWMCTHAKNIVDPTD